MRYHSDVFQHLIKRSVSFCLLAFVCPVMANPSGGQVAGGNASIRYGSNTVVTQYSNRAIVNWHDFSINQGESTRFVQPSSKSVILNRVTGNNVSQIMGNLTANGQVFLVNSNGIVFGKTARVDVAGLVASTANITNEDFMKGNYHFTNAPDHSSIINEGTITIRNAGLAALVAPNVQNSGIIQARLGKVVLGSGNAFTVDLYGDNLISFDATSIVNKGNVTNLGRINAAGGTVLLTASAADSLLENMINTSGYISATSVGEKQGKIILQGYDHSNILVSGTLDVSGNHAGEIGGLVQASATHIQLDSPSVINASGYAGGGTVHIGGEYQGTGTLRHADTVNMQAGALITADALYRGNGGQIILWSDQHTDALGQLYARGGSTQGDGGFIETSSHGTLNVNNITVSTSALYGTDGMWLLDPTDINVDDALATTLTANLASSNVSISTSSAGSDTGNITFTNSLQPVTLSGGHSFTAFADNDIIFNATDAITSNTQSGNITLTANHDVTFNNFTSIDNTDYSGAISVNAANDVNFNATLSIYNSNIGIHAQPVNIRADSDGNGVGTLTSSAPGNMVSTLGPVYMYYSPTAFTSPVSISYNTGDSSPSGVFMLVYDTIAGHQLSDVSSNLIGSYAQGSNLSTGLSGFTPIGTSATPFMGMFIGNSFSGTSDHYYGISNLTINGTNDVGLFGYIGGGAYSNISITNSTITGTNNVGGFAGTLASGFLNNIFVSANVTGSSNVGGIAGYDDSAFINNVLYHGTLTGGTNVGGIAGYIPDTTGSTVIATSLSIGNIVGSSNVGGVVGNNLSLTQNLFDVYSSTSTFNGPAVGSGLNTGASAVPATSLTSLPANFNVDGNFWQTNGSSNYISLVSCGANCVFPISDSGGLSGNAAKQYVTVEQILNNNVLTTTPTLIYYSDGSLMYSVPLATGDGIYVLTVTPDENTQGTIEGAFDALKSAYGCDTSI